MERVRLIISGRVQGVFFRFNTKKEAQHLGLKGYVKNLSDATVEVVAEGPKEQLEKLAAFCKKGTSAASVEDVKMLKEPFQNEFSGFDVRY